MVICDLQVVLARDQLAVAQLNILGTAYGDADLNKVVDANDLSTVRTNFSTMGGWALGNFTLRARSKIT